jgi:hypothetical protein
MLAAVSVKTASTDEVSMSKNPKVSARYSNPETFSRYAWFRCVSRIWLALEASKTTVFCIRVYLAVYVLLLLLQ